jgi:hypothetical protein
MTAVFECRSNRVVDAWQFLTVGVERAAVAFPLLAGTFDLALAFEIDHGARSDVF